VTAINATGRVFFDTHLAAGSPGYLEGEYLTPETRQVLLEEVLAIARGETIYNSQILDHLPDGKNVGWGIKAFLMPGHQQDWGRVRVSLEDISDRLRTEEALRNSEERFRSLFEESPLVMYEEDFSSVHAYVDTLRLVGISDFRHYFHENPQEVRRCASMVKILASNRAARQAVVAEKNESTRDGLDNILITEVSWNAFYGMLVAFCEGKTLYQGETSDDLPNGETIYWSVQVSIVPGSERDWRRVFVSLIDITDRKQFEISLQQSRQGLRDLFDAIPLPTYTWQKTGDYFTLVDCNTTAQQVMKGRANEMMGKSAEENYGIRCPQVPGDIARCFATKSTLRQEREYLSISTQKRLFLSFDYAYVAPDLVLMHTEDITARRAMETALKESEERYRSLFEHVPVPIFILDLSAIKARLIELNSQGVEDIRAWLMRHPDEGRKAAATIFIVDSNKTAQSIFKKAPHQIRAVLENLFSGTGFDDFINNVMSLHEGKMAFQGENFLHFREGDLYFCQYYASIMPGFEETWERVAFSLIDLTDRQKMEEALRESETKFSSIFYNSPSPISITRRDDGVFLDVNQAFLDHCGFTRQEVVGKTARELGLVSKEDHQLLLDLVTSQGYVQNLDHKATIKNGEERVVSYSITPIEINGIECYMTVSPDVTERRKSEAMVKASLQEKEALLKEVNHRVKNNLQVLISLIDLQSHLETSDHDAALFTELQERVRSMSMVHERLYQSPNLARIDFAAYMRDLSDSLVNTYAVNPNVVVEIKVDDLWLGVDTAIPCGLILHELVSNSLKYAFPAGMKETPRIIIRFHRLASQFTLEVCDNGIGLPESIGWSNPTTLGLQLVHILSTHQLGGKLEVSRGAGTVFRLVFPERA